MKRDKERELRYALREIRKAIDAYKDASLADKIDIKLGTEGYPESLEILVKGVKLSQSPDGKDDQVSAPHSDGPDDGHLRLGQAQHAGRSEIAELGRAKCFRCLHKEHGASARWDALCRVELIRPATRRRGTR